MYELWISPLELSRRLKALLKKKKLCISDDFGGGVGLYGCVIKEKSIPLKEKQERCGLNHFPPRLGKQGEALPL